MKEIKRQLIHASGVLTIVLIAWFGKIIAASFSLFIVIVFLILSQYKVFGKEFHNSILKNFERKGGYFRGAITFYLSSFVVILIFPDYAAIGGIAVLAIADSISTLVGYHFGKNRLFFNKNKT